MEYIIASHKEILRQGWKPASANIVDGKVIINENELRYRYPGKTLQEAADIVDGKVIINENELRYRYPGKTLQEAADIVDGIVVSRQTAHDFISGTKTIDQIKTSSAI